MANIYSFSVKDKAVASWIDERHNGNLSEYISGLIRSDMERSVTPDMEIIGNAIEDLSKREIEIREKKEKYVEQLTKMVNRMRRKADEEKAKAHEILTREMKAKKSIMKSMENAINDNGLDDVEKELLDAYKNDKKMVDDKDKMMEFMKKFRDKYKYFLYGTNDIGLYCRYKNGEFDGR